MTQFPGDDGSALSDLRIIDMATIVAGPAAAKYLGDYGADVIKVESPSGDSARRLGWALDDEDDSFFWKIIGRNKKCVAIDLKSEAGLKQMLQLIDSADVLIENFRPGTLERLGLGPEVLLERNPRLVVLRVTGFGQSGPYAGRPGFATVVEALTGYAALSGEPEGQPLLPPIAITDEISGLAGAFAVMTALWYARRTGRGQVVDVNLAETLLQLMGPLVPAFAHLGYEQPRMGSSLPWTVPRGTYQCSDGQWVAISASADSVAARLLSAIGLAGDKRFATFRDRMANQEVLEDYVRKLDRGADRGRGNRSPGGSRRRGRTALHNARRFCRRPLSRARSHDRSGRHRDAKRDSPFLSHAWKSAPCRSSARGRSRARRTGFGPARYFKCRYSQMTVFQVTAHRAPRTREGDLARRGCRRERRPERSIPGGQQRPTGQCSRGDEETHPRHRCAARLQAKRGCAWPAVINDLDDWFYFAEPQQPDVRADRPRGRDRGGRAGLLHRPRLADPGPVTEDLRRTSSRGPGRGLVGRLGLAPRRSHKGDRRAGPGPIVLVNRRVDGITSGVAVDDEGASRKAVNYLNGLGHKIVAGIFGPEEIDTSVRRKKGFSDAVRGAGLSSVEVDRPGWTAEHGYLATHQILTDNPEVTAIYASTLLMGIGALRAAAEAGRAVPSSLSVLCLHDSHLAEYLVPPLTTVRLPTEKLGREAVKLLIDRVEGGPERAVMVEGEGEIQERASTGPPPARS